MVAVVVAVDVLFLSHNFWARLVTNIVIVAVFGVFGYRKFRRKPAG
jgi:membrane-associated PAP2 superfamily phosphatase